MRKAPGEVKEGLLMLRPEVGGIKMLNFNQIDKAAEAGSECIRNNLGEIRRLFGD